MKHNIKTFFFPLLLSFISVANTFSQGILFSEYRLYLDSRQVYTLQVCNPTDVERNFQLSIVDKTVDSMHQLVDIPDSVAFEHSIKEYVRVFPKRISLAPGDCQEIQIQLRSTAPLADGEYRSYLHFMPLLSKKEVTPEERQLESNSTSFDIIMRIGAAIPLFARKNTQKPTASIDSVRILRNDPLYKNAVSLFVHRQGDESVYGDVAIWGNGTEQTESVGLARGNAIYTESNGKRIIVPLAVSADSIPTGPVKITFTNNEDKSNPEVICEWEGLLK